MLAISLACCYVLSSVLSFWCLLCSSAPWVHHFFGWFDLYVFQWWTFFQELLVTYSLYKFNNGFQISDLERYICGFLQMHLERPNRFLSVRWLLELNPNSTTSSSDVNCCHLCWHLDGSLSPSMPAFPFFKFDCGGLKLVISCLVKLGICFWGLLRKGFTARMLLELHQALTNKAREGLITTDNVV
jgi:hypothetical protein